MRERPDDGLFDVCLVRPLSHLGFVLKMPLALGGWHTGMREVTMSRANALTLRSTDGPLLVHLDGELRRSGAAEVEVTLEPARLPVLRVAR
jgi:diacylglycerol kinase family enzyme